MNSEIVRLTREELYERVWEEPVRTVAQQLGISDVGLAKDCRRLRIPVPPRGYWAKKEAGKRVRRLPLPSLAPTDNSTPRETAFNPGAREPRMEEQTGPVADQMRFEEDPKNAIVVADSLRSAHPLVKAAREILEGSTRKGDEYTRDHRARYLDIDVTKRLLPRALRIMDSLMKAFEARGWKVSVGTGDDRKSYVTILGHQIAFGIRETLKKVENTPAAPRRLSDGTMYTPWQSTHHDEPSGKLALVIRNSWGYGVSKSWVETPSRLLEERLHDFVINLVWSANELVERHKRFEEEERIRREAEARRVAEQQRREAEAARIRALEQQAARWAASRQLREYIGAVRERLSSEQTPPSRDIVEWLAWADAYSAALDPLSLPLSTLIATQRS